LEFWLGQRVRGRSTDSGHASWMGKLISPIQRQLHVGCWSRVAEERLNIIASGLEPPKTLAANRGEIRSAGSRSSKQATVSSCEHQFILCNMNNFNQWAVSKNLRVGPRGTVKSRVTCSVKSESRLTHGKRTEGATFRHNSDLKGRRPNWGTCNSGSR